MRDFGASRHERRPDVRFRGVEAAVEQRARAGKRGVGGGPEAPARSRSRARPAPAWRTAPGAGATVSVRRPDRAALTARRWSVAVRRTVPPRASTLRRAVGTAAARRLSAGRRLTPIALMW